MKTPAHKMDYWIGMILRSGVIVSAVIVLAGGLLYLYRYGALAKGYANFQGEPEHLKDIAGICHSALAFQSRGIIQLGLLILIATPIMRVALSIGIYLKEKDWLYVAVTSLVFGLLLYSLIFVK